MSDVVIKAEGLGKKYLIGHQSERERYTALRDVVARNVKSVLNKTRQVLSGQQLLAGDEIEEFWALRDIDFEIKRGDRVGIIGRNGAGKSTLLKILSRITEPSAGRVEIHGRVASLLEVGTGFHAELTGRENIYLNGAILGMTRTEIKRKFDEIVDFSGVEKFLDTPVKRYSSGMYVRLAFAVAAHMEPEILVVDEVLAVGDAEFQKKCLGKMEDVSKNEGRTVLFVSHNMGVIAQLCPKAMYLNKGKLILMGEINDVIDNYLLEGAVHGLSEIQFEKKEEKGIYLSYFAIKDGSGNIRNDFKSSELFILEHKICKSIDVESFKLGITLQSKTGSYLSTFIEIIDCKKIKKGELIPINIEINSNIIAPNNYFWRIAIFSDTTLFDLNEMICPFRINDTGTAMAKYEGIDYGFFNLQHKIIDYAQ